MGRLGGRAHQVRVVAAGNGQNAFGGQLLHCGHGLGRGGFVVHFSQFYAVPVLAGVETIGGDAYAALKVAANPR
ncbi:hypothetical protein D3C80_1941390 [compost metagenome]